MAGRLAVAAARRRRAAGAARRRTRRRMAQPERPRRAGCAVRPAPAAARSGERRDARRVERRRAAVIEAVVRRACSGPSRRLTEIGPSASAMATSASACRAGRADILHELDCLCVRKQRRVRCCAPVGNVAARGRRYFGSVVRGDVVARGGRARTVRGGVRRRRWAVAFSDGVAGLMALGGARPGDRTMVDALKPAADALHSRAGQSQKASARRSVANHGRRSDGSRVAQPRRCIRGEGGRVTSAIGRSVTPTRCTCSNVVARGDSRRAGGLGAGAKQRGSQGRSRSNPASATTPLSTMNATECCPTYSSPAADQQVTANAAIRFMLVSCFFLLQLKLKCRFKSPMQRPANH